MQPAAGHCVGEAQGQCARLIGTAASGRYWPTEREMKLTDLFSRARKRAHDPDYSDEIEAPARLGHDSADRSSMADLVRLLREADAAQNGSGTRPPRP